MKRLTIPLLTLTLASPANALTLNAYGGALDVYNPFTTQQVFTFFVSQNAISIPFGSTATATFMTTMSGGVWPQATMTLCQDASSNPYANVCGYFYQRYNGYVLLDPGASTLHWTSQLTNIVGHAGLNPVTMTVDDRWLVATTPVPGAIWLFGTILVAAAAVRRSRWGGGASSPTATSDAG